MSIKEIQILLNTLGFKLDPDGKNGNNTITAIKKFQKDNGLLDDGIVGDSTVKILKIKSGKATLCSEAKPIISTTKIDVLEPITDKATLTKIEGLHPLIRSKVTRAVQKANSRLTGKSKVRLAQGLRTFKEQDALFAKRPKVTNAKGGQSIHNFGLAVDIVLIIDGKTASWDVKTDWDGDKIADWMEVVNSFKEEGFMWGGDWKSFVDMPHFEWIHDWKPLLAKHNKKDFIKGTTYVNI